MSFWICAVAGVVLTLLLTVFASFLDLLPPTIAALLTQVTKVVRVAIYNICRERLVRLIGSGSPNRPVRIIEFSPKPDVLSSTATSRPEKTSVAELDVHDQSWYLSVALSPSVAFGDGYVDGRWSTPDLKKLLFALLSDPTIRAASGSRLYSLLVLYRRVLSNAQSLRRSKENVEAHYDIGNELYTAMLDPYMQYSCGWWPEGISTIEDAQLLKMRVTLDKLQLRPGMRLLDVGCGWGGLMEYARLRYGAVCFGLTLSREQATLGAQRYPGVTFLLQDYRHFCADNPRGYHAVVSVGMFEHVGLRNFPTFFRCIRNVLKDEGIFLLHTIVSASSGVPTNEWIEKRIFPGGELPSLAELSRGSEGHFATPEDVQNVGPYYAKTLAAWRERAEAFWSDLDRKWTQKDSPDAELVKMHALYTESFRRAWRFYLTSCECAFAIGNVALLQVVFRPSGPLGRDGGRNVLPRIDGVNPSTFPDERKVLSLS
jgi:cyclopropane-fatty-acyl-phospholipid synthase